MITLIIYLIFNLKHNTVDDKLQYILCIYFIVLINTFLMTLYFLFLSIFIESWKKC